MQFKKTSLQNRQDVLLKRIGFGVRNSRARLRCSRNPSNESPPLTISENEMGADHEAQKVMTQPQSKEQDPKMPGSKGARMSQTGTLGLPAVILVGGFGTRIRHLIGTLPKPLAAVCGKPFLHWIFQSLRKRGIKDVYLLTHFEADQIENFAREEESRSFRIHCVKESTPSGTGGAVLDLLTNTETLSKSFLLLNGDSLLMDYSLESALNAIAEGCEVVIFGVPMEDASRYGTLNFNEFGQLLEFREKAPGAGVINTGAYLFTRQAFSRVANPARPISLEVDVIPSMIESGVHINVLPINSQFIDIGTEASLAEVESFVRHNFQVN